MKKYGVIRTLIQDKISEILPDYETYKEIDNIWHTKKIDDDTIIKIWISVIDRKVEIELSLFFVVLNIRTEIIYSVFTKNEYFEKKSFTSGVNFNNELHRFYVKTDAQIDLWIYKAQIEIRKNIEGLEKYQDIQELEKLFNYDFKNKPIEALDINHNQILKGLIMSKLVNEEDYLFLFEKALKIYEYGGFVDSLISECKELNIFLTKHSKQKLSDINYLRKLINQ